MQNFFEWFFEVKGHTESPWLILGKGPSYSKLKDFDSSEYLKASLNHVVREQRVEIAHIIDADVMFDCAVEIYNNAEVLVMPWKPHIRNNAGKKPLDALVAENETLSKMASEGRIKYYNLASGGVPKDSYPVIPTNYFSSEAVVNLLTACGVKKIRTLGVDGGRSYSPDFKDLERTTLLNNGHSSFDIQFRSIAKKIMKEKLDYAPLDVASPVKVYVGSIEPQMIAVKVLEYSIKKNASLPVEVTPLFKNNIEIPVPKGDNNKPRTPFSFQRFLIPELNGFKGKAIYVDSDMQVFADVKNLWTKPMDDHDVLSAYENEGTSRKPQFSVMLLDCDKLKWDIRSIVKKLDSGELTYESLMYQMKEAKSIGAVIEREWNSLEHYDPKRTNLLHYTDMDKQPWLFTHNPLTPVWVKELAEALNEGFIKKTDVKEHIKRGYIRPSLWLQLRFEQYGIGPEINKYKWADYYFTPPHLRNGASSPTRIRMNSIIASLVTIL